MAQMTFSREELRDIFQQHDLDGDGTLTMSELMRAFSFLGSVIPFYKAKHGLAQADEDGDGRISMDELDKLVDYAEKLHKRPVKVEPKKLSHPVLLFM